jgi:hypothetical protein
MHKALVVGLTLISIPLLLLGCFFVAVQWPPMDAITMSFPQGVRNIIGRELLAQANFGATGFSAARRAVKLNPASEEAWIMSCATGVKDGKDMEGALRACSRAASMIQPYDLFYSQVIAEAYEEAHRPCDGLPVLSKTMGEERVNNISAIFEMGRLEVTCGQMDAAESYLRAVVRLREEDLRSSHWEDRPPGSDGPLIHMRKLFDFISRRRGRTFQHC